MKAYEKIWLIILLCGCISLPLSLDPAGSQEQKVDPSKKIAAHRVIRLDKILTETIPTITVQPGTTVIWINDLVETMIEIEFSGKNVTLACKSPVHFAVGPDDVFISDKIPSGAVASLCLIEKGEFDYLIRRIPVRTMPSYGLGASGPARTPQAKDLKGKIIVE